MTFSPKPPSATGDYGYRSASVQAQCVYVEGHDPNVPDDGTPAVQYFHKTTEGIPVDQLDGEWTERIVLE